VQTLSVRVPAGVALQLLEGDLGRDVAAQLAEIPRDVSIGHPDAAVLLADDSAASVAWRLLEKPHQMGPVTTAKLWLPAAQLPCRRR
jgi:hypothetical protein